MEGIVALAGLVCKASGQCYVMLCYMVICKAPLTGGYSDRSGFSTVA